MSVCVKPHEEKNIQGDYDRITIARLQYYYSSSLFIITLIAIVKYSMCGYERLWNQEIDRLHHQQTVT